MLLNFGFFGLRCRVNVAKFCAGDIFGKVLYVDVVMFLC